MRGRERKYEKREIKRRRGEGRRTDEHRREINR